MNLPIRRVVRSKDQARSSYTQMSRWYDIMSGNTEEKYRAIGLQKLNAHDGERILEIGFGTGHCILALAKAVGKSGKVYGVDLSEGMLAVTQARIQKAGLAERVDLRAGDALALPFAAGDMDGVFMSFTLELFDTPEIPQVLNRCYAALRPGGRLVVVSMIKKNNLAIKIYEWFHDKMPNTVDCRPIFAQEDLKAAGFAIRDVTALSMWGLPVEIILAEKPLAPSGPHKQDVGQAFSLSG